MLTKARANELLDMCIAMLEEAKCTAIEQSSGNKRKIKKDMQAGLIFLNICAEIAFFFFLNNAGNSHALVFIQSNNSWSPMAPD